MHTLIHQSHYCTVGPSINILYYKYVSGNVLFISITESDIVGI